MTTTPQPPQPQPPQAAPPGVPQAPAARPGGLTALAVLNFVFGGLGLIGMIVFVAGISILERLGISVPILWVHFLLGLVAAAMLIVSGVGYLKMSKATGYSMGMVYALVAIVNNILGAVAIQFSVFVFIGLAYPVLTIILLNTAFKKCFR